MKNKLFLMMGLIICGPISFIQSFDNPLEFSNDFDDDDDDFFEVGTNPFDDEPDEETKKSLAKKVPKDVKSINGWNVAIQGQAKARNLLHSDLFLKSSPIRHRNITTFPINLNYLYKHDICDLSATLFFNKTNAKNFTQTSTTLNSYALLENNPIADVLEELATQYGIASKFNIGESLQLLAPAKVQEHNLGILFQLDRTHNDWTFDLQIPLLYAERNLFLTDEEKNALYGSALAQIIGSSGDLDEWEIAKQHFISDQIGIGDLKFRFMKQIACDWRGNTLLGGFISLPTAFAIKKGVIGTHFQQNNDRAPLPLEEINPDPTAAANLTDKNKEDLANFFSAASDHLMANILHTSLGNKGHINLGLTASCDWYINDAWSMNSNYALEIPIPAKEKRFFIKHQTQEGFDKKYNEAKAVDALSVVNFARNELKDRLFPLVYNSFVFPGVILNSITHFSRSFGTWNCNAGWNFWYQGAEKDISIDAPITELPYLDIKNAFAASASQFKIFGKIHHIFETKQYQWSLSLYGDATIWNSGIGNDFTLGLSVDYIF